MSAFAFVLSSDIISYFVTRDSSEEIDFGHKPNENISIIFS